MSPTKDDGMVEMIKFSHVQVVVCLSKKKKKVVVCLMYSMICIRPNITYVVSVVSKYMANPGKKH